MGLRGRRRRIAIFLTLTAIAVVSTSIIATPAQARTRKCFGRKATIVGTNRDDVLRGTRGRDVIVAKGGDDRIRARGGSDFICAGGGGFDLVFAGGGNDRMRGGKGFDLFFPSGGRHLIDGGGGFDFITYEDTPGPIRANLRRGVVSADGRDRVKRVQGIGGTEADDVIVGDGKDNDLEGFGGNDVIRAGAGNDFTNAGAGNDRVAGGPGDDLLDLVVAHAGPKIGDDVLATSGAEVDLTLGTVTGGADVGNDTFSGIESVGATLGNDTIVGDEGHNHLFSWAGTDNISSGDGDDLIAPGPDDDTVDGGAGMDVVDLFASHPFEGGTHGPVTVDLSAQTVTGQGTDDLDSIEGAIGTLLDDTIMGSDANDFLLLGDEGSDTISGRGGDDLLDGDAFFFGVPVNFPGSDTLNGGAGTDTCLGGETTAECEQIERSPLGELRALSVLKNRYRPLL